MPPDVLLRPEVIAALNDWNWSKALRIISASTNLTQTRIGESTGLTQATVSRLMNGKTSTPTIQTIRALCDGLGIPRDLAGLAPKAGTAGLRVEEEATDRRDFITGVGAAAVVTFTPLTDLPERLGAADAENEVLQLREAVPALLALNDQHGGTDGLCRLSARLVSRADALVQHGLPTTKLTHEVQVLAGILAMYAGWLYYDGGNQTKARGYWQHALYQAQLADDQLIEVYALESLSTQATFFLNRAPEGVLLAKRAQTVATRWATPRLGSLLCMREATAWAAQHDAHEFERAYRRAVNLFPDRPSSDDPDWINFYVHAEVDGLKALSFHLMDNHVRAEALFRNMLGHIGPELRRNQVYYTSMLGHATAEKGDIVGATEVLEPHLGTIAETGSWRARKQVREVVQKARESRSPQAIAFADSAQDAGI